MSILEHSSFPRPASGDCAAYYFRYIDQVPEVDIVAYLEQQESTFGAFIQGLTPEQLHYRYEPGKWSLAEMIGHLLDSERVFSYRMMCISRGEQKSLLGFEQNDYVEGSVFDTVSGEALAAEWYAVRSSSIHLCKHMNAEMASRRGLANDTPVVASSIPWILAGHVNHHVQVARERYLHDTSLLEK